MKRTLLITKSPDDAISFEDAVRDIAGGDTLSDTLDIKILDTCDEADFANVDYLLAWLYPEGLLGKLPKLKFIVSGGAGVDHLMRDRELPDVPVARFVDDHLTRRMTSYVATHALLHTRRQTEFLEQQRAGKWHYFQDPLVETVRVGLLGLGTLGEAAAGALVKLGFDVRGWSRTPKDLAGVKTYFGDDGRDAFLAETDILVALLPLTKATRGILNRDLFGKLSLSGRSRQLPGPVLINAGRGGLQVEADIFAALDDGTLYAASLDVFDTEPLPQSSPFWSHPRVIVTPHAASVTDPRRIARYALRQIRDFEAGAQLENLVDKSRGY